MDVHTVSYGMSQTTFKILIKKQFAETSCTITVCVVHKQLTLQPPIHADMIIHAARPKCKAGSALSANEIGPWYVGVLIERYSGVKIINYMIKYKNYNLSHLNIFWKWIQSEIIWPSCSQYCDFISLCCAVFVFPRVLQMPNIYFTTEDTDAVVGKHQLFLYRICCAFECYWGIWISYASICRYDIINIGYFKCSLSNPMIALFKIIVSNISVDICSG